MKSIKKPALIFCILFFSFLACARSASAQDTTPPVVSISAPAAGGVVKPPYYETTSCRLNYEFKWSDNSPQNVMMATIALRNSAGQYWHITNYGSGWSGGDPSLEFLNVGGPKTTGTIKSSIGLDCNPLNFPVGTYTLEVRLRDNSFNLSAKASRSFIIDIHKPSSAIASPKPDWLVSSAMPISGTAADQAGGAGIGAVKLQLCMSFNPDNTMKCWNGSNWVTLIYPNQVLLPAVLSGNSWRFVGPLPPAASLSWGSSLAYQIQVYDKAGNVSYNNVYVRTVHPNGIDFAAIKNSTGIAIPAVPAASWKPMHDYGIRYAVSRAWGGRSPDIYSGPQLRDARVNTAGGLFGGIRTAAYVFLNFDNGAIGGPANQTGRWQVEQALAALGDEAFYMTFIAIDVEDLYKGNMTAVARVQRIQEAVQAVKDAGFTPIIYSRKVHWEPMTGFSQAFKDLPLWSVRYAQNPAEELADKDNDRDGPFATNGQAFGGWTVRDGKQYSPVNSATDIAPTAKSLMQQFGLKTVDADMFDDALFLTRISTPLPLISLTSPLVASGGSTTATLTVPGIFYGVNVALSSSNASAATVPTQVFVPADTKKATFTVKVPMNAPSTAVTIKATISGCYLCPVSTTATLNVGAALSSITFPTTSAVGGQDVPGTVTLNANAPAGGAVVKLSSSNTALAKFIVPGTTNTAPALNVTVPAGQKTAPFTLNTTAVTLNQSFTITGAYNIVRSRNLTLTPPPATLAQDATEGVVASQEGVKARIEAAAPSVSARAGSRIIEVLFPVGLDPKVALDAKHYKVEVNAAAMPVQSISYNSETKSVRLVLYRWGVKEWDDVVVSWEGLLDGAGKVLTGEAAPVMVSRPAREAESLGDVEPKLSSTPDNE